jgi:hypothetical protein
MPFLNNLPDSLHRLYPVLIEFDLHERSPEFNLRPILHGFLRRGVTAHHVVLVDFVLDATYAE